MKFLHLDTSALMQNVRILRDLLEQEDTTMIVCSTVLEELDNHKDGSDGLRSYKARQGLKFLNLNKDKVTYDFNEEMLDEYKSAFMGFDMVKNDNKILYSAYYWKMFYEGCDKCSVALVTGDRGIEAKCAALEIECIITNNNSDEDYKGYLVINGNTDVINKAYEDIASGEIELLHNQYLIISNTDTNEESAQRWDGEKLVRLRIEKSPIKPLNIEQACALDSILNNDIPINIVIGNYGSGKTLLAVKTGDDMLNKGKFNKMSLVMNPEPAGNNVGYLPGGLEDKLSGYFKSMTQYLDNGYSFTDENEMMFNAKGGTQIELEPLCFLRGRSMNESLVICDYLCSHRSV